MVNTTESKTARTFSQSRIELQDAGLTVQQIEAYFIVATLEERLMQASLAHFVAKSATEPVRRMHGTYNPIEEAARRKYNRGLKKAEEKACCVLIDCENHLAETMDFFYMPFSGKSPDEISNMYWEIKRRAEQADRTR